MERGYRVSPGPQTPELQFGVGRLERRPFSSPTHEPTQTRPEVKHTHTNTHRSGVLFVTGEIAAIRIELDSTVRCGYISGPGYQPARVPSHRCRRQRMRRPVRDVPVSAMLLGVRSRRQLCTALRYKCCKDIYRSESHSLLFPDLVLLITPFPLPVRRMT